MEKKHIEKMVGKIFLSLGSGGILAVYLVNLCRLKLLPISEEIGKLIAIENMTGTEVNALEPAIILISIFSFLISPLFIKWNKKRGIEILILFFAFFIDISGAVIVVASGEISGFYIFCLWITATYVSWICIEIINILYYWIKKDTSESHYDIVKLTFVWTIIAFILGKVW